MAKYDALREHLVQEGGPVVTLSFAVLDGLLPGGLPPSARRHRVWWQNNPPKSHVQARAWHDAGYVVEDVGLPNGPVTFRRV